MITYPTIDPVLVHIGPLAIRWYGLAYLGGILASYLYLKKCFVGELGATKDQALNFVTNCMFGLMIGGRVGYVLFYDFYYFLENPLRIFAVWTGGMSYHGGAIGAAVAVILFSRKNTISMWTLLDYLAIGSTFGLFFGRIANFINAELWGRVTDVAWGMVFPGAGLYPRHPSQLYEAFFEGVFLFLVLHTLKKNKDIKSGMLFCVYVFLYGLFRFFIEFFREPDAHLGAVLGWMSMGQVLCVVMMVGSLGIGVFRMKTKR